MYGRLRAWLRHLQLPASMPETQSAPPGGNPHAILALCHLDQHQVIERETQAKACCQHYPQPRNMHLLRTRLDDADHGKFELVEAHGRNIPPYAILSHTWGRDEVLYRHILDGTASHHDAYDKVVKAMQQAARDGFAYIWIDTCCIDKSSSAELSEAINSMYVWYQRAEKCYAILETVPMIQHPDFEARFRSSRWFTRGWTLQELLAPRSVEFFGHDDSRSWSYLGDRVSLEVLISSITSISSDYLRHLRPVSTASVAQRMSWASGRETTREEDIAYCLLGLFSVNMPMLYGEGPRAFMRLQEEILKNSDDQSIFAWTTPVSHQPGSRDSEVHLDMVEILEGGSYAVEKESACNDYHGMLADSPAAFARSGEVIPMQTEAVSMYLVTNRGIMISLPLASMHGLDELGRGPKKWRADIAPLRCRQDDGDRRQLGVYLIGASTSTEASYGQHARVRTNKLAAIGAGVPYKRHNNFYKERFVKDAGIFVPQMPLSETSHHTSAFCLLHRLEGPYKVADIEVLGTLDGSDVATPYPSETLSARRWVPPGLPKVFRIPLGDENSLDPAFLKIRLEMEGREPDWVEVLVGVQHGDHNDPETIWGQVTDNSSASEPQRGRFKALKGLEPNDSRRVNLMVRDHVEGDRKLFLIDFKVKFKAREAWTNEFKPRKLENAFKSESESGHYQLHWKKDWRRTTSSPKIESPGTCTLDPELIRSLRYDAWSDPASDLLATCDISA